MSTDDRVFNCGNCGFPMRLEGGDDNAACWSCQDPECTVGVVFTAYIFDFDGFGSALASIAEQSQIALEDYAALQLAADLIKEIKNTLAAVEEVKRRAELN